MPHLIYFVATSGYTDAEKSRRLAIMRQFLPAGMTIEIVAIADSPRFLDRAEDFKHAVRAAQHAVGSIGPQDCAVIVSGGALDPGLNRLRKVARVPIVGPGETSLFFARLLGSRLAIVTVDEHAVAAARAMVKTVRTRPEVVSIRSMNTPVRLIMSDLEVGRAALRREAFASVAEDGADVVYLGAMTLGTLGITQELRHTLKVPVIDPLPLALYFAQQVALTKDGVFKNTEEGAELPNALSND